MLFMTYYGDDFSVSEMSSVFTSLYLNIEYQLTTSYKRIWDLDISMVPCLFSV